MSRKKLKQAQSEFVPLRVSLNGTDVNTYAKAWGLRCNPFPQYAKHEVLHAMLRLNELDGDPIPKDSAEAYIREKLRGFSKEFVDHVVARFVPGERVKFTCWIERKWVE
jgi:hypothetical protein